MFLTKVCCLCTVHTFSVSHGFGDDWSNIMLSLNFQAHDIGDFHSIDGEDSDVLECCAVCTHFNLTYFDDSEGTQCLHFQRLIGPMSPRIYQR
jgi:hypothetical protein